MEPFPFDSDNFDQCMVEVYREVFTRIIALPRRIIIRILRVTKNNETITEKRLQDERQVIHEEKLT